MSTDKLKNTLTFFKPDMESTESFPYFGQGVSAGFPSPALDFIEQSINLNRDLSQNPAATFFIKVKGNSMIDAGIDDKDILVVDRALPADNQKIAVCLIDGEFTVKRLKFESDCIWLMPENKKYAPIKVADENQFLIWGIVTYVIKKLS